MILNNVEGETGIWRWEQWLWDFTENQRLTGDELVDSLREKYKNYHLHVRLLK